MSREAILHAGLLVPAGASGIYARSAGFEAVIDALTRLILAEAAGDGAERLRFPPVMSQAHLERNGYFSVFPHLAGCVHCFMGDEADHRRLVGKLVCEEDTASEFSPSGVALVPAACYPVYPAIAARGPLPKTGLLIEVASYCFRHEPSDDLARQQSFRMQEFVRIGPADAVAGFRRMWLDRAVSLCSRLDLPARLEAANDPFFGSGGQHLAEQQRESAAKIELILAAGPDGEDRSCFSCNAHGEHFAAIWGLRLRGGRLAHTACIGFGLERFALALFTRHGTQHTAWPGAVREALGL